MAEVAIREPEGLLSALGVEHTSTSLTLPADISYEDYESIGAFIGIVNDASNWWLGDWLVQGELLHKDKIYQATELTRRSPQTLANVASCCRNVPPSRRNPKLSFSAHVEVKALEPADQRRWLKTAEQEALSTHELRARVQAERAGHPNVLEPREEETALSVYEAARNVWIASTRSVGDVFLVPAEPMLEMRKALGE